LTKFFNKLFPKKSINKRGISPVIATILLIALTVSAAAIVYFVVVPLLKGDAELVQMTALEIDDSDADGKFDTITTTLFNIGTDMATIDQNVVVTIYSNPTTTKTWTITSSVEYATQETKEITIETDVNESQLDPLTSFDITLSYGSKSLVSSRGLSPHVSEEPGGGDPDPLNYTGMALYLRTATEDPSTSRGSFPTSSGYSPLLWFMVGIFKSGTSNLHTDTNDYIDLNGFGAAQDYHPYVGLSDTYSTDISSHTGYQIMAYNDSGRYPGCVTFRGTSFDADDNLDWPQRGIVYMFTYIYNPTAEAMDVDLSIQVDDAYSMWVNGDFQGSGTQSGGGWKTWRAPVRVTMNPGYNIISLKTADAGGNWDAQILLIRRKILL
jgi:flagellin-like protein